MRPGTLAIMAALLVAAACQDGEWQPPLLYHDQPTAVDHGHQYWAGLLTFSESGECLQLREVYEDGRVETRPTATGGVFRPVWPSGYRPEPADGGISVLDANGRVVASTGDIIRIGGRIRAKNPVALADEIPPDCRLLAQKLVGRDVTVITNSEASVLGLPGHSLHFPRERTRPGIKVFRLLGLEGYLRLHGSCLRVGGEDGPVPIWPPGFEPHLVEGGTIEVRSSGGATIARTGDWIEMLGVDLQRL